MKSLKISSLLSYPLIRKINSQPALNLEVTVSSEILDMKVCRIT